MRKYVIASIVTTSVSVASPALATPVTTIANSGFEIPGTDASGVAEYTPGQTIGSPGWTVLGNPGTNVIVLSSTYTEPGVNFSPHGGNYALDITGTFNQGASVGVAQTLSTTAGTNYARSFWVGNVTGDGTGNSGVYTGSSSIALQINGATVGTYTNSNVTVGDVNWEQFTYDFAATGTSTGLAFLNATSGDNYAGLDDVSITTLASAVPEPSTWVMMILGFCGLGRLAYRRQNSLSLPSSSLRAS